MEHLPQVGDRVAVLSDNLPRRPLDARKGLPPSHPAIVLEVHDARTLTIEVLDGDKPTGILFEHIARAAEKGYRSGTWKPIA